MREAENLTDRIERLSQESTLFEHKVFVLRDNSAFEGAYYKGHSPSEKLNDIVFRLHKAERDGGFILHILHISGKRMKATGVNGLSRGDLTQGVLAGVDPFSFLPFNQGVDKRSKGAVGLWVRSWWRTKNGGDWGGIPLGEVTGETMFELQDLKAARLWLLAPAVMETALDLFCDNRLAHPHWPHVFVTPRLMTHMWRKALGKDADVLFTVPVGVNFWASGQFEPLIVAIVFPLLTFQGTLNPGWLEILMRGHATNVRSSMGSREMTQENYMSWMGACNACGKMWRAGHGLFCSNYLLGRGGSPRAEMSGVGRVTGRPQATLSQGWTRTWRQTAQIWT